MEQLVQNATKFIKEVFQNDFSGHDFFHSMRVYRTAMKIAQAEHADMEVVALAALLHDVDDRKLSPMTAEKKENAARFPKLEMDLDCDCDSYALSFMSISDDFDETVFYSDALEVLRKCKAAYSGITLRGIEALELKSLGYSTREIADRYETTVNNVNAWISRARAKLREDPQMLQFAL